jgi:hypothetical protein
METLYQKTKIVSRVKKYFLPYIELLTKPSGHKFFMLLLAIIGMQTITSMQYIYTWFLRGLSKMSLNAYYYLMGYTKLPIDRFAEVTMRKAIGLIEGKLAKLPVLLLVDDTLQEKFGTHFECCEKMFDHAKHNGSSYLNGHCFVALAVCVPVTVENAVKYLTVPIRFRARGKDENKLAIASEMIRDAMKALTYIPTVILLCDSWYPKGEVLETVEAHENLELIANVRVDTAIYDLPVATGKRGRPAKKGRKLSIYDDFSFTEAGRYFVAARTAMTNLFKIPVYITVTATNLDNCKGYRLFLSTIGHEKLCAMFSSGNQAYSKDSAQLSWLLPLCFYFLRWNIEVMFYELKTFWSFGKYMLRSKNGIENFVYAISLSYACAKLLPFADEFFADFSDASPQTTKFALADAIRKDLFFAHFLDFIETHHISPDNLHDLDVSDFFLHSS